MLIVVFYMSSAEMFAPLTSAQPPAWSRARQSTVEQREKEKGWIDLEIQPRFKEEWGQFEAHAPPCSIALDGRVIGPVQRNFEKRSLILITTKALIVRRRMRPVRRF
jgi:hypothetical protein